MPLEPGRVDGHLVRARGQSAVVMAGSARLAPSGALEALGSGQIVGFRLEQAVQRVLDRFLTSSRGLDLRLSSFNVAMDSGTANLQHFSRIDDSSHTEAGRAVPSVWTLFCCRSSQEIVRYRAGGFSDTPYRAVCDEFYCGTEDKSAADRDGRRRLSVSEQTEGLRGV